MRAGEGVGTVTRAGLALAVGEPAINPAPRAMIREALVETAAEANGAPPPDLIVTIAIPGGERLAEKTMNARLGILGGLSVLGTTGIVVPYSCSLMDSFDPARDRRGAGRRAWPHRRGDRHDLGARRAAALRAA